MDGTILGQGTFTATGTSSGVSRTDTANNVIIQIPSGADWVKVVNYTQFGKAGTSGAYFQGNNNAYVGYEFYWQRGMAVGTGIVSYKSNASAAVNADTLVTGGFTLYDPSGQTVGAQPIISAPVATTASTNATRPVVSTTNTAGISIGTVVRMSNTAQNDVNGIDMVVGAVTLNTNFTLLAASNALATAPGAIGGAGFYRIINTDPLFYPRRRYVTNITQAANAQVSTSVAHGLTPGQSIRFNIPSVSGMVQLNSTPQNNYLTATIVSLVDLYNFTINIDTTSFTAFTWPTIAQQPSSFPTLDPVGEDTAVALLSPTIQIPGVVSATVGSQIFNTNTGILADSTVNTGFLGMILGGGGNGTQLTTPILGPAGSITTDGASVVTGDVMYWRAGKSTYGGL